MKFCVNFNGLFHITIAVFLLLSVVQVCLSKNPEIDVDDFHTMEVRKTPHRRKSPRMAFLQETDDPLFKFLTKILNTAQLKSKGALTRAQNGIKRREELKTELTNTLKENHISEEYY